MQVAGRFGDRGGQSREAALKLQESGQGRGGVKQRSWQRENAPRERPETEVESAVGEGGVHLPCGGLRSTWGPPVGSPGAIPRSPEHFVQRSCAIQFLCLPGYSGYNGVPTGPVVAGGKAPGPPGPPWHRPGEGGGSGFEEVTRKTRIKTSLTREWLRMVRIIRVSSKRVVYFGVVQD